MSDTCKATYSGPPTVEAQGIALAHICSCLCSWFPSRIRPLHGVACVALRSDFLIQREFLNAGQIWCAAGEVVDAHDFPQDAIGRAVPYGIYDLNHNRGTVYIGQSADTPAFAVDNIAHWCATELQERFPGATQLLIEADSGGSNSARSRVWKQALQAQVADHFGLRVTACHYPTGASKWNPIEHRLFSEISKTWAGCPLRSFELAAHYIGETRTATGLTVEAHLVSTVYTTGVKIPDEQMATLNIHAHEICPQWNYTLHPRVACTPSGHDAEVILL